MNSIYFKHICYLLCIIMIISFSYIRQNNKDIEVAKVICAEMCSEGDAVMYGVANTIKNRMIKYNKTAYEIITEKNQYYGYTNKNKNNIFQNKSCKETSIYLAKNINDLKDITKGALYFRMSNEKIQPWHKTLTVVINNIYFYR